MRSHFIPSSRTIEFLPPAVAGTKLGSQFRIGNRAAMACAVSGATAMMAGACSAQIAADYATNSVYAGGWSAGQNGGHGFGAWSFNATDPTPPGQYQLMSSSSALGTAWTLLNYANNTGLANAGRAINGGLQSGQVFETVIQNPASNNFFRGFDILFTGGTTNNASGVNTAAIRLSVFNYGTQFWGINDPGSTATSLTAPVTADKGVKIDLTLTSATAYSLTMTPLDGAAAYTHSGVFTGPINYVDYREWDTASSGQNDAAHNFEIGYMTIAQIPEPSTWGLIGLGSLGLLCLRRHE